MADRKLCDLPVPLNRLARHAEHVSNDVADFARIGGGTSSTPDHFVHTPLIPSAVGHAALGQRSLNRSGLGDLLRELPAIFLALLIVEKMSATSRRPDVLASALEEPGYCECNRIALGGVVLRAVHREPDGEVLG